MRSDPSKAIDIIAEHGTFLLIRAGSRFAVVERRNGLIYPMQPGERDGVSMTAEGLALLPEEEWLPEHEARRLFNELSDRGERLAQSLR